MSKDAFVPTIPDIAAWGSLSRTSYEDTQPGSFSIILPLTFFFSFSRQMSLLLSMEKAALAQIPGNRDKGTSWEGELRASGCPSFFCKPKRYLNPESDIRDDMFSDNDVGTSQ